MRNFSSAGSTAAIVGYRWAKLSAAVSANFNSVTVKAKKSVAATADRAFVVPAPTALSANSATFTVTATRVRRATGPVITASAVSGSASGSLTVTRNQAGPGLHLTGLRGAGGSIAAPAPAAGRVLHRDLENRSASSVTTLYLARHGQSEWNNQSRITGQFDIALSPRGQQQSEALAQCLADETLAAVYSSALQRTIATAQPTATAKRLNIVSMPELNEIHLGVLQGRHRDERDTEAQALWAHWQADPWGYRVPGGERFDEFAQRVEAGLTTILEQHRGQRILIVGHRATNRVLLGHLLGWPRERWAELRLRNKYFYRLRLVASSTEIATFTLSGSKTGVCTEGFVM